MSVAYIIDKTKFQAENGALVGKMNTQTKVCSSAKFMKTRSWVEEGEKVDRAHTSMLQQSCSQGLTKESEKSRKGLARTS